MARFQSATEIFDIWVDGSLWKRRFAIGAPAPAPQVVDVRLPAAPDDMPPYVDEALYATYAAMQRELLAAGWSRVHDPEHEVAYPDDPREETLERALRDHPDDDETWLVYADLMIQRGHPRGQLMAIESAPVKNVVHRAEREAETFKLRQAAADVLVGPLSGRTGLGLTWRRGFIYAATLRSEATDDVLFELLTHPSARLLRELDLSRSGDARLAIDLLFHLAPPLRSLSIHSEETQVSLGDLGALGTVFPQLEKIELEGGNQWRFDGLSLPRARSFTLYTTNLQPSTMKAIVDAPWPRLEELALEIGSQSPCTITDLQLVLDGTLDLPALRTLRITDAPFGPAIVHALVRAPLVRQLRMLDLRGTRIDDDSARLLIDIPDLKCELTRRGISNEVWDALRDAGRFVRAYW